MVIRLDLASTTSLIVARALTPLRLDRETRKDEKRRRGVEIDPEIEMFARLPGPSSERDDL